jgi:hypothetical protein
MEATMNVKRVRLGLLVPLVLVVVASLACGKSAEPTATALPRPTQKPKATATEEAVVQPTKTPRPTKEPQATATEAVQEDTPAAPFTLAAEPYAHKSGAFTITLPDGWNVDEKDNSVFVTSPDNVSSIEVNFTNVGVQFDDATLSTFIDAVEANWFGTFDSYSAGDHEPQSDGSIGVFKTLNLSDGTAESVFSYYWQKGTVVYEQDFWVDSDQYDAYKDGLIEVANSMQTTPDAGAQAAVYAISYKFTGPNNLFEFYVPYGWTYTTDTGENSTVDRFESPDGVSYVENITYDDGKAVSKSDSGAFARVLLKDYYNLTDIKITDDKVQSDGSERLTWYSAASGIDGISFFETRGTTFLLLTWIVNSDSYDLYYPVWDALVNSYAIPQA